jgi:hypothetical protein
VGRLFSSTTALPTGKKVEWITGNHAAILELEVATLCTMVGNCIKGMSVVLPVKHNADVSLNRFPLWEEEHFLA